MKIIHRVAFRHDSKVKVVVTELGLPFKNGFICVCDVDETDLRWNMLKTLLNFNVEGVHSVNTHFTKNRVE